MIDTKEFELIQKKIATLKDKKSKAEGAIESVMGELLSKYAIHSIVEAEAQMSQLEVDIQENEEFLDAEYSKLKKLHHWEFV